MSHDCRRDGHRTGEPIRSDRARAYLVSCAFCPAQSIAVVDSVRPGATAEEDRAAEDEAKKRATFRFELEHIIKPRVAA